MTTFTANLTSRRLEISKRDVDNINHSDEVIMPCGWENNPLAREQHIYALAIGKTILYESINNKQMEDYEKVY